MENRFDLVTIANAVCVAVYVAITLGYIALCDLGISREAVRAGAVLGAVMLSALLVVDFFDKKHDNAK